MSSQSAEKIASIIERNLQTVHVQPPLLSVGIEKNKSLGRRGTVLVSCADPRITPEKFLGLEFAEAAIIRNAGGRARSALPSLLALDTLGNTGTIVVIHHTDCGMSHYSESEFQDRSKTKHPEIDLHGEEFGAIVEPEKTVKQDVEYLRSFESWGKADVEIVGLVLDTFSGIVKRVI
ncbi:carbonic anhydrase [Botrytis cinerea]